MPKRDRNHRRALLALGVIVVGAVLTAVLTSWIGYLEEAQRQACEQPAQQCEPNGNDDPYNGWRDTNAQWSMAVFAALGLGVGGWTIVLLQRTIVATRKGNKIARQSAERQLRAYVHFGKVKVKESKTYAHPIVVVEIKNTGATPAHLRGHRITTVPGEMDRDWICPVIDEISPQQSTLGGGETAKLFNILRDGDMEADVIYVYGKVVYDDVFGNRWESYFTRMMIPPGSDFGGDKWEFLHTRNGPNYGT